MASMTGFPGKAGDDLGTGARESQELRKLGGSFERWGAAPLAAENRDLPAEEGMGLPIACFVSLVSFRIGSTCVI